MDGYLCLFTAEAALKNNKKKLQYVQLSSHLIFIFLKQMPCLEVKLN